MKSFNLIKLAAISAFGLVAMLGTSQIASAQSSRGYNQDGRNVSRQQGNVDRQRTNVGQQRQDDINWRNDRHQEDRNRSSYDMDRRSDQDDYNSHNRFGYDNGGSRTIIGTILRSVRSGSRH